MSGYGGGRPSASRNGVGSLWTGIFVGMVIGVSLAAGVTWYLMRAPSPFLKNEQTSAKPPTEAARPPAPAETGTSAQKPSAASGEASGKPRFEFYKVLTDKQDAAVPPKRSEQPRPVDAKAPEAKPAAAYEPHFLQAGSFQKVDDAEKLKARLALLGVEASVHSATIPEKGVWYRVRLGPYKSAEELNGARNFLKQNGVESTPIRAQ